MFTSYSIMKEGCSDNKAAPYHDYYEYDSALRGCYLTNNSSRYLGRVHIWSSTISSSLSM